MITGPWPSPDDRMLRRIGASVGFSLILALVPLSFAQAEKPRIDFMLECRGCHLADGTGVPGKVPALRDSMARFLSVPGGRAFLVQVPGSAQSSLDDAALAGVLNWMLAKFGPSEFLKGTAPYTAREVGQLRANPLIDVVNTRRALIRKIEAIP